ncbi:hypothetical protein B6U99_04915 [Candidatus Geothermarchaeota archaeon ex4572_27]|nr:MAG: hypothetical protein B6U99_04915 [Candidatus Geothermarchaeota archaeon ex4572_27]
MLEFDLEEFRRRYPNLARELERGVGVKRLSELVEQQSQGEAREEGPPSNPTAIDYLRRCRSVQEALEVLDYLERTGEISRGERQELEERLLSEGLESFGPRKGFGYYSEKYLKDIDLKALQRRLP